MQREKQVAACVLSVKTFPERSVAAETWDRPSVINAKSAQLWLPVSAVAFVTLMQAKVCICHQYEVIILCGVISVL